LDTAITTALRYRLFKIGKMPAALKSAAEDPAALLSAEGVSVKASGRSVALPGVRAGRSVRLLAGAVVLLPGRLLASVGAWPVLDAPLTGDASGAHQLTLAGDGVHLHIDVPSLYDSGRGTIDVHFRTELEPSVLAQVPTTAIPVALPDGLAAIVRTWV
jgi:hypothetical protein